ncbi:MAG: NapC/NirT family cytochrome c [Proteobacteria bacterium]|nr:NapC/NirT family cytochrome c [Pseudomonadota bacterium]MBU1738233.1 NapC/NirT family cytochrome c [Pseudomonadota bacterium]
MKKMMVLPFSVLLVMVAVVPAFAGVVCFKCHAEKAFTGAVVHSPVAEGECTICHNPHVARFKGLLHREVAAMCYTCHDPIVNEHDDSLIHRPVRLGDCLACHNPHAAKGKGLLKEEQQGAGCFNCHKDLTREYKVSHAPYAKGECSACHLPHQAEQIQLLKSEPEKLCRSCHKGELPRGHQGFPGKPAACLTCHNPHGSSRAGMMREVFHAPFAEGCGDCHEGGGKVGIDKCLECHEEVRNQVKNTHSHLTGKKGNSCINCHSPHAADNTKLFRNRQIQVCRTCHQDTFASYVDKLHSHPDTGTCGDCHEVHGSVNLAMLKGNGNQVCSRCHETQGQFTHPVGETVLDPRTGLAMTCVNCHYPHGTDFQFNLKLDGSKDLCIQCHRGY